MLELNDAELDNNLKPNQVNYLETLEDLLQIFQQFPRRYLFIGSGAKLQFAEPQQAINEVIDYLNPQKNEPILIIFGGDTADNQRPDLGYLVQQVKAQLRATVQVLSVQSWPEYCPFVDYIFKYPRTFCKKSKRELWGGLQNGVPVAATHYYLNDLVQKMLTALICVGGGEIAKQELAYVIQQGTLKYHYIRAEVRHHRTASLYGPAYDWYSKLEPSSLSPITSPKP